MPSEQLEGFPTTARAVDRAEAAALIGICTTTLDAMAANGSGPRFFRVGRRVKYRVSDVESWMAEQAGR
jgi:predicted DNA-binding transcriptional regulator AlpA